MKLLCNIKYSIFEKLCIIKAEDNIITPTTTKYTRGNQLKSTNLFPLLIQNDSALGL